jgi:hypothetical protein
MNLGSTSTVAALLALLFPGGGSAAFNLTFMFLVSHGKFGFNSSGAIPAADMALEDVNSNDNILPGYNLVYDEVRDSQVITC